MNQKTEPVPLDSGEVALWAIAICLYGMLGLLIYALWSFEFTLTSFLAAWSIFYVGAAFGIFVGYVLAHVFRRGFF